MVACGTGALAARWRRALRILPRPPSVAGRIWHGDIDVRLAMLLVYPLTIIISFALVILSMFVHLNRPDGSVSVERVFWIVSVTQLAPPLIFVAGSLITVRALNRGSAEHSRVAILGQTLLALLALTVVVSAAKVNGFVAGEQVQSALLIFRSG